MNRLSRTACLLVILCLASCKPRQPESLVPDEYGSYKTTTDIVLDYPIPGHEDRGRRIFINPRGEGLEIERTNGRVFHRYPEGTVIIKEIFEGGSAAPGGEPVMLTAMVKAADHPDARGGWVWIMKDTKTETEAVVKHEFCVTCHSNANEPHPYGDKNPDAEFRDYVFFPFMK
jgi:hypothetical protein